MLDLAFQPDRSGREPLYRQLEDHLRELIEARRLAPAERVRAVYSARRAALLAALGRHMPEGTRWIEPAGGDAVWLTLPTGIDPSGLRDRALDARVGPHPEGLHEIGFVPVHPTVAGRRFFPAPLHVYQWHYEGFAIPDGADRLATGQVYPNQAFRVGRRAFGLQFHPEATPQMRRQWLDASGHMLDEPGAHGRERQEADAERFEQPMEDWLLALIDSHLLPAG